MAEPVTIAVAASAAASSVAAAAATTTAAAASPGFFAAASGFAAGFLLSWPALVILVILGIVFESYSSTGWAVLTGLAAMAVAYFFFSVSLATAGIAAAVYVPIGLVWSLYRYKRHASKAVEKAKNMDTRQKEDLVKRLHPKAMLGTIVQWIMIWPFSMIENLLGDLIHAAETLVTKWFRGVYHTIYDGAVKSILG